MNVIKHGLQHNFNEAISSLLISSDMLLKTRREQKQNLLCLFPEYLFLHIKDQVLTIYQCRFKFLFTNYSLIIYQLKRNIQNLLVVALHYLCNIRIGSFRVWINFHPWLQVLCRDQIQNCSSYLFQPPLISFKFV